MDSERLKLVTDGFAAYARGDEDALRTLFDPQIEVYAEPEVLNAGTFRGWDGWKEWTSQWEDAWEEIAYEPLDVLDVDEALAVVPVRIRAKGRRSGIEITDANCYLFEIRSGRLVRFHLYSTQERALEAARRLAEE